VVINGPVEIVQLTTSDLFRTFKSHDSPVVIVVGQIEISVRPDTVGFAILLCLQQEL
jgi:hypothetical protein